MSAMKLIQDRARELKKKDPSLKHQQAVKLAAKQLREEGVFGKKKPGKRKKKTPKIKQTKEEKLIVKGIKKLPETKFRVKSLFELTSKSLDPIEIIEKKSKTLGKKLKKQKKKQFTVGKVTLKELLSNPAIKKLIGSRRRF